MADFLLQLPEHLICEICSYLTPMDMARLAKVEGTLWAFVFESGRYDWTRAGRVPIAFDAPAGVTLQFLARVGHLLGDIRLGLSIYKTKKDGHRQTVDASRSDVHCLIRKLPVFSAAQELSQELSLGAVSANISEADFNRICSLLPSVKRMALSVKECQPFDTPPSSMCAQIVRHWPRLDSFQAFFYRNLATILDSDESNQVAIGLMVRQMQCLENLILFGVVNGEVIRGIQQLSRLKKLAICVIRSLPAALNDWLKNLHALEDVVLFWSPDTPILTLETFLYSLSSLRNLNHLHMNLPPTLALSPESIAAFTTSTSFRLTRLQLTILLPTGFSDPQIFEVVQSNPGLEVVALDFKPDRWGNSDVTAVGLRYLMRLPCLKALCINLGSLDHRNNAGSIVNGDFLNSYQIPENSRPTDSRMFEFFGKQFSITPAETDAFFDRVGCDYILTGADSDGLPEQAYWRRKPGLSFATLEALARWKYRCCFLNRLEVTDLV